ncbi:MAG: C4-dicarboxylate transporter DctA [Proteobacteria bacterium]|nr:C4-dicarboxylate transporter DctA [Pseudomonadota bacterium]
MRGLARSLYFWVLVAVAAGALVGTLAPDAGVALKPLGDGFIRLIRMLVGPIVFCTIVLGIAHMRDLPRVGRVGIKALAYFEVLSTVALGVGMLVGNLVRPGDGFHVDPSRLDASAVAKYASAAHEQSISDFLLNIIPTTLPGALTSGELLQVLVAALLTGFGAAMVGERAQFFVSFIESASQVLFRIVSMVMWAAPIGAFGAMAFTLGKFGWHSLAPLARFMGVFYLTCALFVFVVLGLVARWSGFSLWRLVAYLRTEILTVIGTSSSESVLALLIDRLERLGCRRATVGLVVPTGYSFNLDGTCIYLSLAVLFLAQALDVSLSLGQQLTLLVVAMLSSKGAATVTGGGFITLAATLTVVPSVPVAALALILGIDRFMSEARAVTNLIGNAVATLVISRWEGEISATDLRRALAAGPDSANPV